LFGNQTRQTDFCRIQPQLFRRTSVQKVKIDSGADDFLLYFPSLDSIKEGVKFPAESFVMGITTGNSIGSAIHILEIDWEFYRLFDPHS
jgi:hypothetical protein